MKIVRITSAALFLVSILMFGFTLFGENRIHHAISAILLFGSLGTFSFTEGFMFKPPMRTKFSLYAARFMFIGACIVVAQILYALVTGQVQ